MTVADTGALVPRPNRSKRHDRLRLGLNAAKLVVSVGLVGYLLARYAPTYDRLSHIDFAACAAALALIVLQTGLNTLRWRAILMHIAGARLPSAKLFPIYYTSVFFAQILPSVAGDLVRVLYHRMLRVPMGMVIVSVLLDRVLATASLLLIGAATLPLMWRIDPQGSVAGTMALVSGGGLLACCLGCAAVGTLRGTKLWAAIPQPLQTLATNVAWALSSRMGLGQLIPASVLVHSLTILAVYIIARALGAPLDFGTALAIGPALLLAHIAPVSIGGWGVREAAAIVLLGPVGIDEASAVLVSVTLGLLIMLATLPGAVFWLLLREESRSAEGPHSP
jgi:uncharacterized membrane protein YbhN (UPF0104 family)